MPDSLNTDGSLDPSDSFLHRHIGPSEDDIPRMLAKIGCASLDALTNSAIPADILLREPLSFCSARSEHEALAELRQIASHNRVFRSLIGMGYHDCITPPVIQRNIFENPGWYTQYTPYQAEIAQGRLEALMNFQTLVADLTALPLAGASLLDEATAAAEAMTLCRRINDTDGGVFFVAEDCHAQTIAVMRMRAKSVGIELRIGRADDLDFSRKDLFGILLQYPTTDGRICDYQPIVEKAHASGALVAVATDLLALTLLRPPGEFGADIAIGSAQRFGVPLGFGGPHAAFLATRDKYKRQIPGRLVGVSKDVHGRPAYRLAIQTREQHIRREKATSNICTAQVLLAIMAGMYAVYHGPAGLQRIAKRIHALTATLAAGLEKLGHTVGPSPFFDTIRVRLGSGRSSEVFAAASDQRINLRDYGDGSVGISLDEKSHPGEIEALWELFNQDRPSGLSLDAMIGKTKVEFDEPFSRQSDNLTHPVFNRYHCETEFMRYLTRLQQRDLSLATSMIPLGSCTMKLNAAAEMVPVSWPEFANLHPMAPADQTRGYAMLFDQLRGWLAAITGLPAVSLQPNAGAQGEYAGLLVIRAYHENRGEGQRRVCLIPTSAHGTNAASAVMAGMRVVTVACDKQGNIDVADLKAKAEQNAHELAALMVTYPSTHGVFEQGIRNICAVVHEHGGQVYMDGANMNAQVGLCQPGDMGADICHLNLHKTFCIPHGGGGPGVGPICAAGHLAAFLPSHPWLEPRDDPEKGTQDESNERAIGPVSAAPFGSAGILPISWMYIAMMGADGLRRASQVAILNANYMAKHLEDHYPIVYTGTGGRVAHEFIIDCRAFEKSTGIKIDDIAKRLMDYGFHAPTMSWPVHGGLMIEPTESESRGELDRFCEAMISIRGEIRDIEEGRADRRDNLLNGAPHTALAIAADDWPHPYSRHQAAFPATWVGEHKFWPAVGRIDNVWGDRHLICSCPPPESYQS